jgi:hypothetical protein
MTEVDYEEPETIDYVPWEWEQVVCNCPRPEYGRVFPAPTDNTICVNCNKIARWLLLTCGTCKDRYLFAFKHHARTVGISMGAKHMVRDRSLDGWALDKCVCWNCINAKDPAVEGDRPPAYTQAPRVMRSFEEIVAEAEAEEESEGFSL